jgi:hypothetical protein
MSKHDGQEERFISSVNKALDKRADDMDSNTLNRLAQMRRCAVQSTQKNSTSVIRTPYWFVSAGAAAVLVVATSIVYFSWYSPQQDQNRIAVIEDINMLSAPDELELYEDLEFFQWLTDEEGVG